MKSKNSQMVAAWLIILAGTIFRLYYSGLFELAPDEANYWQWGRHLAWGYHDQAPLIGWAIRASTFIFGDSETAVRLPSIIAMAVASAYLILLAKRFFGSNAALQAAILSQGILEFNLGGLLATPDGLQAAAWAAASFHVAEAYKTDRFGHWLAGGFWFGAGMLSKYTMVLFAPCAFAYGLTSPLHRERLFGIKPYVAVLFGLMLFAPVIFWNFQHDWSSLRHVAYLGGADRSLFEIHPAFFGDFIASQAALVTPIIFILIIASWLKATKSLFSSDWKVSYLFMLSFPVFAFFAILSLHARVYGNWPGFAYITAAVLASSFYGTKKSKIFMKDKPGLGQRSWPWAILIAYLMSAFVLIQAVFSPFPIPPSIDRTSYEINGWKKTAEAATRAYQEMPNPEQTFIFGLRYQIASELAFYMPGRPETVSINRWNRPNVYDYWFKDEDLIGKDGVGVTRDPGMSERLKEVFERVDGPEEILIHRRNKPLFGKVSSAPVKMLYLYRAYGFKGGLRWVPKDPDDIRAIGQAEDRTF